MQQEQNLNQFSDQNIRLEDLQCPQYCFTVQQQKEPELVTNESIKNKGYDIQGIYWGSLTIRQLQREYRLNSYQHFFSITDNTHTNLKKPNIGLKRLHFNKGNYTFKNYIKNLKMFRCHLQLNNNLKIQEDDIYYLEIDGICKLNRLRMQNIKYEHSLNDHESNLICNFDINRDLICLVTLLGKLVVIRRDKQDEYELNSKKNLRKKVEVVYDLDTNELDQSESILNCVNFYEGGRKIITGSNDRSIKVIDLQKQKVVMKYINGFANNHISFNNSEDLICLSQDSTNNVIIDLRKQQKEIQLVGHNDYGFSSSFNINNNYIATSNQDLSVRIWDLRKYDQNVKTLYSNHYACYNTKFSKDGKYLVCPENIDYLNIYNFYKDCREYQKVDFFGQVNGVDFDRDNNVLLGCQVQPHSGIFTFQQAKKTDLLEQYFMT